MFISSALFSVNVGLSRTNQFVKKSCQKIHAGAVTLYYIIYLKGGFCVVRPPLAARLHLTVVKLFWSFGINDSNTFSIENWIPLLTAGAVCVIDVALFIISHDSIKPSLQFSFLYFGLVALEESTSSLNYSKYATCSKSQIFTLFRQ